MSTAHNIAAVLGGARREGRGWRCRCPIHGGHSLVISDGPDGRLLVRCWGGGCDPRAILAELRRLGLLDGVAGGRAAKGGVRSNECDPDDVARRLNIARGIWEDARDARATALVLYLPGAGSPYPRHPPCAGHRR